MYNTFQLDDDFDSNTSVLKSRTALSGRTDNKFMSGTITKNFFKPALEEEQEYIGNKGIGKCEGKKEGESSVRSRRSKKHTVSLTPIQQSDKVEVFQNLHNNFNVEEIEELSLSTPPQQLELTESDVKRRVSRRKGAKKQEESPQSAKVQQAPEPIKAPFKPTVIYFEDEQEEIKPQPQHIEIPQTKISNDFVESDDEPIVVSAQIVNIITGSQYFNFKSEEALKKQLFLNVREKTTLKMEIVRDKGGFNTFWPEFHLHFSDDSHYVMSSKKTSSRPTSTFIISRSRDNFEEDSPFYLGKMKSNVLGDVLNVFGPGVEPGEAKQKKGPQRQLLATIVFITSLFQIGKPREFQVYIKKPEFIYYKHFPQVKEFEEQIPLHSLYEFPENKDKIRLLRNRQPVWMNEIGGYMLNFRGRVERPSIKNFIIEQTANGPDLVLFGKTNDNKFNFDVSARISPFIAFAIALSSFDSRLMCE